MPGVSQLFAIFCRNFSERSRTGHHGASPHFRTDPHQQANPGRTSTDTTCLLIRGAGFESPTVHEGHDLRLRHGGRGIVRTPRDLAAPDVASLRWNASPV